MINNPLISFIIPTYNRAHIIEETLNAIRSQTYDNWECIVVDDGSTDNTEELLQRYSKQDPRFIYLKRPDNRKRGGNAARNYGFENSNGTFINFIDSDDLIHKDKLKLQLSVFQNNENCHVCLCEAEIFNKTKRYQKKSKPLDRINFFEDYISKKMDMGTIQPLWKKSFLDSTRILFDENLLRAQDFDFFSRMSSRENFSFCFVKKVLVSIRTGDYDRITSLVFDKNVMHSYLNAYLKTYILLVSNYNNEDLYKRYTNLFLKRILKCVNAKEYEMAVYFLKEIRKNVFKNRLKYNWHFLKLIGMISLLEKSQLRGYSIFKKYYFLN